MRLEFELPPDWTLLPLEEVADVQTGIAKGKTVNGESVSVPYLRVANVQDGHLDLSVIKEISVRPSEVERYSLKAGDVLFTEGGDFDKLGRGTVWRGEIQPCLHQNHVFSVRTDKEILLPELLAAQASSRHGRRYFQLSSKQSTNLASINSSQLKRFPVLLPPPAEQLRIAEILRTWDEAIEKLETLRAAKERRRQGVLQYILGRGVDFPGGWKTRPLNKISERIRRTNDGGDHPVMTISAKSGFLMQSDKFARDMAGSSVDRYTLLHEGEFAYNKGNSKTAPYGCIFALDRPTAVIPFVYFCFRLNDDQHHAFFEHLFAAGVMNHQLSKVINSGVRNDGLLNLYADDFFACEVPVPPRNEQERIARAVTALNDELALIDKEITALKRQKRGLMQKLLTGEWRTAPNSKVREALK